MSFGIAFDGRLDVSVPRCRTFRVSCCTEQVSRLCPRTTTVVWPIKAIGKQYWLYRTDVRCCKFGVPQYRSRHCTFVEGGLSGTGLETRVVDVTVSTCNLYCTISIDYWPQLRYDLMLPTNSSLLCDHAALLNTPDGAHFLESSCSVHLC